MRWVLALLIWTTAAHADPGVEAVSAFRAQNGRAPLAVSETLSAMAAAHAADLSRTGRLSHQGSDGSDIAARARRVGYGYCYLAENVARGQKSLTEVLRGWAGSRGHRRNMLARQATEAGFARAPGNVWVLVLGRPGC